MSRRHRLPFRAILYPSEHSEEEKIFLKDSVYAAIHQLSLVYLNVFIKVNYYIEHQGCVFFIKNK